MSTNPPLKTTALERFLRYVTYDTQSDENSETYPSTAKQLVLLDQLVEELQAIGLEGRRARRARLRLRHGAGHDEEARTSRSSASSRTWTPRPRRTART